MEPWIKKEVRPYTEEEFDVMFQAARKLTEKWHRYTAVALLTLLQATSLSLSELSGFQWGDFDVVRKGFHVRRGRVQDEMETARLKTQHRERFQPLPEWAFKLLQDFKAATEGSGFVFRGR